MLSVPARQRGSKPCGLLKVTKVTSSKEHPKAGLATPRTAACNLFACEQRTHLCTLHFHLKLFLIDLVLLPDHSKGSLLLLVSIQNSLQAGWQLIDRHCSPNLWILLDLCFPVKASGRHAAQHVMQWACPTCICGHLLLLISILCSFPVLRGLLLFDSSAEGDTTCKQLAAEQLCLAWFTTSTYLSGSTCHRLACCVCSLHTMVVG